MLKQPVGFVKLTNVALIKYKVEGKKLEIACYKNKAINWRNGVEKNLAEVLQIDEIFTNTIQGEVANKKLLTELFPGKSKEEIIQLILDKGEMQVSQKEREALLENVSKDIVNIVAKKIVHPKSKRHFSMESIKAALKEISFNPKFNQPSKKQALEAIKELEIYYQIERVGVLAKIKVESEKIFENLHQRLGFEIEQSNPNESFVIISPKAIQELEKIIEEEYKGKVELTILDNAFSKKSVQAIDDHVETTLQRRENVDLPKKTGHGNTHKNKIEPEVNADGTKKKKKSKKTEYAEEARIEDEKKVVLGFNSMTFGQPKNDTEKTEQKNCATCQNSTFPNIKDYKEHIKSEWHKFNLQKKMKGEETLSLQNYQDFTMMQDFIKKK